MAAWLARIQIFPVKSLEPQVVESVRVLPRGGLTNDRRFALVDAEGQYVNGKRTPLVHRIRSRFDERSGLLHLSVNGQDRTFDLTRDRDALEQWLTAYLGMPVRLREDPERGFPDDEVSPGPTFISRATLERVASWFPGLGLEETRLRFRANLEIDGVEAFWEDRLCTARSQVVRFRVGSVQFEGVNPCQRCAVPGRTPATGEAIPEFARVFAARRQAELPAWATASRFDHYYRLAVNTRLADIGEGILRVGDPVTVHGIAG